MTVGIVVVSHSPRLAEGVCELAREMGVGRVAVEAAGGDEAGGLGTSIERIEAAVAAAGSGMGVVLLADIGSSVLTARMFLEDRGGGDLALADAPLVEGAVAAASAAGGEADLSAVVRAAESAWSFRKVRP